MIPKWGNTSCGDWSNEIMMMENQIIKLGSKEDDYSFTLLQDNLEEILDKVI